MNSENNIHQGLDLLSTAVSQRLYYHFGKEGNPPAPLLPPDIIVPALKGMPSLNMEEYIIVFIALAPHISPSFFDAAIQNYLPQGGDFPEFGGIKSGNHRGMQPTGETVQFILAGMDIAERVRVAQYFSAEHFFYKKNILSGNFLGIFWEFFSGGSFVGVLWGFCGSFVGVLWE